MVSRFEPVSRVANEIKLPERATKHSAGYDFFAVEDVTIEAKSLARIMTGVKCKMKPGTMLVLANRSSNPSKKGLILANGIGIVDSDYYDNPDNEGEIGFEFYNMTDSAVEIKAGDKLGQGVFVCHGITSGDTLLAGASRAGGFGSTGV